MQCPLPSDIFVNYVTNTVYVACSNNLGGLYGSVLSISIWPSLSVPTFYTVGALAVAARPSQCYGAIGVWSNATVGGLTFAVCYGAFATYPNAVVAIYSNATVTGIMSFAVCPSPRSVAGSTTSNNVYVACNTGVMAMANNGVNVRTLASSAACVNPYSVAANIVTGNVYAACLGGTAGVVSITTGGVMSTIATTTQCPSPTSVWWNPNSGVVTATCSTGGVVGITCYNMSTVASVSSSPACNNPVSVFQIGTAVYAACGMGGSVVVPLNADAAAAPTPAQCAALYQMYSNTPIGMVLDSCIQSTGVPTTVPIMTTSNLATQATTTLCPFPTSSWLNTNTQVTYLACSNGVIIVTGSFAATLVSTTQCPAPTSITGSSITGMVYVACFATGGGIISINPNRAVGTVLTSATCPSPISVFVNPLSGTLYAACNGGVSGGIVAVSPSSGTVVQLATATQCPNPMSVIANPFTGIVYAACSGGGVLAFKHVLALSLMAVRGAVPEGAQPDWIVASLAKRQQSAEKRAAKADKPKEPVDSAAQAKRREKRADSVSAGVAELQIWLRDLVRGGLSAARSQPAGMFEDKARRMVDAQAPGLAAAVRELGGCIAGRDWENRSLAALGRLYLLTRAWDRRDALPPALAEDVNTLIGLPRPAGAEEDEGLTKAGPWTITGTRIEMQDDDILAHRVWLQHGDGTPALLLNFAHKTQRNTLPLSLVAGQGLDASLAFLPGVVPLRATLPGAATLVQAAPPAGHPSIKAALDAAGSANAKLPWLPRYPLLLDAVVPMLHEGRWLATDSAGDALPLTGGAALLWTLLSLSGGGPVPVFGEWTADGLLPLTLWTGGQAQSLDALAMLWEAA